MIFHLLYSCFIVLFNSHSVNLNHKFICKRNNILVTKIINRIIEITYFICQKNGVLRKSTWTNRAVTINRAYSSSSGNYLASCTRNVSIIRSVGDSLDDAKSQCKGSYNFNFDGRNDGADYCFHSLIDPANSSSAELNIIY